MDIIDANLHQGAICRRNGVGKLRFRMVVRQEQAMGNRRISRIHPPLFIRSKQVHDDLEAELHSLAQAVEQDMDTRAFGVRHLFQHRVQR